MKLLTSCCCCILFSIWLHHLFLWLNSKSFEHYFISVRLWLVVSCLLERVMRCVAWWPCLCHRTWLNENCCCCCTSLLWIVSLSLFHHHPSQRRIRSEVVPPHWILLLSPFVSFHIRKRVFFCFCFCLGLVVVIDGPPHTSPSRECIVCFQAGMDAGASWEGAGS